MKLPIGNSDFREIISDGYTFVDKSLLIKDIIDDGSKVLLFTRPRRFGKTLNMQMLQHFFSAEVDGKPTRNLFDLLKITQVGEEYLQHQGKYPVIFLTFKDIKSSNYEAAYAEFADILRALYAGHRYLLTSEYLQEEEKENFSKILTASAPFIQLRSALKNLTEYLYRYSGVRPIVLIDEYDTPIQSSYIAAESYYQQMMELMRGFLGAGLKDNNYLSKAILTGILRISKESIFSDLNNLKVRSLLDSAYGEYFGFTESEVESLLEQAGMLEQLPEVRAWYNGYQCGDKVLYNPWSILNYIDSQGELKPYWINTSDNTLIKQQLVKSSSEFKAQLSDLLKEQQIERFIDDTMVFTDLSRNPAALWSLLLATGYLKVISQKLTPQGLLCQLALPNQEIHNLFRQIIEQWLANGQGIDWYNRFIGALLRGDVTSFEGYLRTFFIRTGSYFDMAQEPEAFYHGLMLGLAASLEGEHYDLKLNHESGYGRYDIAIIAKKPDKLSIIIELKIAEKAKSIQENEEVLSNLLSQQAEAALEQINEQQYGEGLAKQGIGLLKLGIAFYGKHFKIAFARADA
jgi:hypothetical protein